MAIKSFFTILSYVYVKINYNFDIIFNFGQNWLRTARFNSLCVLGECMRPPSIFDFLGVLSFYAN
jgi:hypothetical protein